MTNEELHKRIADALRSYGIQAFITGARISAIIDGKVAAEYDQLNLDTEREDGRAV